MILAFGVLPGVLALSVASSGTRSARPTLTPVERLAADVIEVELLTGADSPNHTDARWNVYGTDLGHPILHQGDLYLVFGDTWGSDGVEGSEWRSNVLARLESPDPRDGLRFAEMVTDDTGQAAELLPSLKIDGVEKTVIPTYGISTGDRMVLHYMSVRHWGSPGHWDLDHAGFAWSDDDGRSWTIDPDATFAGDSNFGQVALVEHGGFVYVYGIPGGRFGDLELARVAPDALLEPERYEYWDGTTWSTNPDAAAAIVPAPVGELSVQWNEQVGRWLMMYLDESIRAIVIRTAPDLKGPWSGPRIVTTAREYPRLYAPYLIPSADGDDVYFTMSEFGRYQVSLMRFPVTAI